MEERGNEAERSEKGGRKRWKKEEKGSESGREERREREDEGTEDNAIMRKGEIGEYSVAAFLPVLKFLVRLLLIL